MRSSSSELMSIAVGQTGGSAENSENARTRRSRLTTSSTTICAACSIKARRRTRTAAAAISSMVRRMGVSEFFTSCAILRARLCQLSRRVTYTRRSCDCLSSSAMWLKPRAADPISSLLRSGTR